MFEENIKEVDTLIRELESGNLTLDEAIKDYEKAMKLLSDSKKQLIEAEGKVHKVIEENDKIKTEEL